MSKTVPDHSGVSLEENKMASNRKNTNLDNIKMQAANEVGVPLKDNGYNGDLTSRQAGSVGGQMVKNMSPKLRNRNQYYIPLNNAVYGTLTAFSLSAHRVMRRNLEEDIDFNVQVMI